MQRIVLVEDNEDLRDGLAELLRSEGYPVSAFSTVREAWSGLGGGATPALVLLDLDLPVDGGETLLCSLAEHPSTHGAHRVILVTASPGARVNAARAHPAVVAVLTKPSSIDLILETVRAQLPDSSPHQGAA